MLTSFIKSFEAFGLRLKDYLRTKNTTSAVAEHICLTGHSFPKEDAKILSCEDNNFKRRIKEAIAIKKAKAKHDLGLDLDLPIVYDPLLSCDMMSHGNSSKIKKLDKGSSYQANFDTGNYNK